MSDQLKTNLKPRLSKLKCHFTWILLAKNCDTTEIEDVLYSQLDLLVTKNMYMVHNLLSYFKHLKGDHQEAITHLQNAEEMIRKVHSDEVNRRSMVTYSNLAWVYYYIGQYDNAVVYIDKVEAICQELKSHNFGLAEIYGEQGWSLLMFGRKCYEKAKECFEKALELDPENSGWNSGFAIVTYHIEDISGRKCPSDRCKSLQLLNRAVQLNPQDSVVKVYLALKLQELKQVNEAKLLIEDVLKQSPDLPFVLRHVAKFYRNEGLIDEALCALQRAVKLIPTSGFIHHQIGLCYRQILIQKRFRNVHRQHEDINDLKELTKKAIFHFEKVLEYRKSFIFAHTGLAEMYIEEMQYEKAEEIFQKALNVNKLSDREKQQIYFNYGRFQEYCRKSDSEAVKHYKEGLRIPAKTRERQNCETALIKLSKRINERDSSDASGYSLLGFVYKQNQKTAEAIECYKKALALDPGNEDCLTALGDLKLTN